MGRTRTKQSSCWGFMVPVPMRAACCAGNTGCPGSSPAFPQESSQAPGSILRQLSGQWGKLMQFFPYSPLCSSAVTQRKPVYQNWEQHAALTGALNKTLGAAQWHLNFCYIVAGIILSSFVSLLSLPLFLLKKSTEWLDLQMNGQGSDNRSELELRSTGIITVINSSSRGTASVGSIAGSCRGREMGEEEWPAAEIVLWPTGPRSPLECLDKKSVVVPCPCGTST